MSKRYSNIVFMQGDEGYEMVDRITSGPRHQCVAEAVTYLSQWDTGDDYDVRDESCAGPYDERAEHGGYLLTWNASLGYVGLERIVEGE